MYPARECPHSETLPTRSRGKLGDAGENTRRGEKREISSLLRISFEREGDRKAAEKKGRETTRGGTAEGAAKVIEGESTDVGSKERPSPNRGRRS